MGRANPKSDQIILTIQVERLYRSPASFSCFDQYFALYQLGAVCKPVGENRNF